MHTTTEDGKAENGLIAVSPPYWWRPAEDPVEVRAWLAEVLRNPDHLHDLEYKIGNIRLKKHRDTLDCVLYVLGTIDLLRHELLAWAEGKAKRRVKKTAVKRKVKK
jgi:hypothetical protein